MGHVLLCATKALVILMDQLAKKFDEKFVMPFILVDLMPSRKIMITYLLHKEKLGILYCLNLLNKKTLKVAQHDHVEFLDMCYVVVKAIILNGLR
jgi:hypothetical protein